ncbi:MAG: lipid II flippase MurJ [Planctomycetota bacterium]
MSHTTAERIVRSGVVVIIAHAIIMLAGVVQNAVLGHYFASVELDAFIIAFEGILYLAFLVGEGAIGPAFLPVFNAALSRGDERAAWQFANGLLSIQNLILAVLVPVFMLWPAWVVRIVNGMIGQPNLPVPTAQDAFIADILRYMGPGLIGMFLGTTTYKILNGYKRFFWAAIGDTVTKAAVIGFVLLLCDPHAAAAFHPRAVMALGLGVAVGGFGKLAIHILGFRDKVPLLLSTRPAVRTPEFRTFLLLVAPLLLGIVFAKVRDFINNIILLRLVDIDGIVAAHSYGAKLFKTIGRLVPYAISLAMLPYFCDMVDRNDRQALGAFMSRASRMLLLFFFPLAIGAAVLSHPMVRIIFAHGKFNLTDWVATANICYVLVLPFYSLEYFFMQGFFADRRTVAPVVLGIASSALAILLGYLAVAVFKVHLIWGPVAAIVAVAGSYVLSRIIKIALFIHFFRKNVPVFTEPDFARFLLKVLVVTAITGLCAAGMLHMPGPIGALVRTGGRMRQLLGLALAVMAGGAGFLAAVRFLRFEEFDLAFHWALEKVRRRRAP